MNNPIQKEIETNDLQKLKALADTYGVKYSNSIGLVALRTKLEASLNENSTPDLSK